MPRSLFSEVSDLRPAHLYSTESADPLLVMVNLMLVVVFLLTFVKSYNGILQNSFFFTFNLKNNLKLATYLNSCAQDWNSTANLRHW